MILLLTTSLMLANLKIVLSLLENFIKVLKNQSFTKNICYLLVKQINFFLILEFLSRIIEK